MSFVLFISRRLRLSGAASLSALGIAAGVATLIVVMAVMNGFQMSFKDAIIELSSAHIRVTGVEEDKFIKQCSAIQSIRAVYPFREEKAFIVGSRGRESAAVIRAVPHDIIEKDKGFAKEIGMTEGTFLDEDDAIVAPSLDAAASRLDDGTAFDNGAATADRNASLPSIVLGSSLASILGVRVGGAVTLLALSGGSDSSLLSVERVFCVAGIFRSGYSAINESFAFVSLESAAKYFGEGGNTMAVKLTHPLKDGSAIKQIQKLGGVCQSWREYNSAFFGVLRVEKNMMLAIVAFIFVAVSVNIYNAMRREVYTRKGMIALLAAVGGRIEAIRLIFIMRGFQLGLIGAVWGTAAGLAMSVNMKSIFMLPAIITQNPMYTLYASIPARAQLGEVLFICAFALASPLAASWAASSAVLNLPPQETLRYE